jgi:hypothetical protein
MKKLTTKTFNVYGKNNSLRHKHRFIHHKLPSAKKYYQQQFHTRWDNFYQAWVSVQCCFHEDLRPSLRINLLSGAFRCFACGNYGSDIISFHQKRYGLSFRQCIDHFNAWG